MKFNVTVEVPWVDEDESLDEAFEAKLFDALLKSMNDKLTEKLSEKAAEHANALVKAKTELLINTVLESPITITEGWNNKTVYESIFDMVEKKMTALYEGKLNLSGQCTKDPLLGNIENFVKQEVTRLTNLLEKKIKDTAASEAKKAVNESELVKAIGLMIK